ncbi:MAG: DUF1194 domain-containing protein [Desulfobacca sp.]|uniref:DUF1194 domain-containing protein n=1 Tax=Desulfobacca sp. TaxID=2067990 RepID=UPI004048FF0C
MRYLLFTSPVKAIVYDLELALIADVSGSISTQEFNLQQTGYRNAFKNTVAGLFNNPNITVQPFYALYGQWSSAQQQIVKVDWTLIDSATAAKNFGDAIFNSTRAFSNLTAVQSALNWAGGLFNNNIDSKRRVIDISGDGVRNDGLTGTIGRDNAVAAGVTSINGIVIGGDPSVKQYYQDNVIYGTAFLFEAAKFEDFEKAISQKIAYEVLNTPIPGSLLLFSSGLFMFRVLKRRQS